MSCSTASACWPVSGTRSPGARARIISRRAHGSALRSCPSAPRAGSGLPWLLFTTGLVSMGMEVVWVRQLSPFLGTVVYAFASILAIYLGATFVGAIVYRRWARAGSAKGDSSQLAVLWSAA